MENELLKSILAELKEIKESNERLEADVSEIKMIVNKGVYPDIVKLEKRVEVLERKIG